MPAYEQSEIQHDLIAPSGIPSSTDNNSKTVPGGSKMARKKSASQSFKIGAGCRTMINEELNIIVDSKNGKTVQNASGDNNNKDAKDAQAVQIGQAGEPYQHDAYSLHDSFEWAGMILGSCWWMRASASCPIMFFSSLMMYSVWLHSCRSRASPAETVSLESFPPSLSKS